MGRQAARMAVAANVPLVAIGELQFPVFVDRIKHQ
jgi:hypothetical protein